MRGRFLAVLFGLFGAVVTAQSLRFEVAAIKPVQLRPGEMGHAGLHIEGDRFEFGMASLTMLILTAYQVDGFQLTGPDFLPTARFDIQAKMPEGATKIQVPEMLRTLLAERFGLRVRHEKRDQQVYALVIGKDGSKLKQTPSDFVPGNSPFAAGERGDRFVLAVFQPTPPAGWATISVTNGGHVYETKKTSLPEFARFLTRYAEGPVMDQTGLEGYYEITLDVPPNTPRLAGRGGVMERPAEASAIPQASDPAGGNIFASVQKLGLKLEKRRAQVDHLVVEHIDKTPSEN